MKQHYGRSIQQADPSLLSMVRSLKYVGPRKQVRRNIWKLRNFDAEKNIRVFFFSSAAKEILVKFRITSQGRGNSRKIVFFLSTSLKTPGLFCSCQVVKRLLTRFFGVVWFKLT